jgi:hypothetical protein
MTYDLPNRIGGAVEQARRLVVPGGAGVVPSLCYSTLENSRGASHRPS